MARFIHLLYYFVLTLTVLFVVYLTTILALSPKNDMLKRGFIPCTTEFVNHIATCERGKIFCPLSYIWQDTKCNTRVILEGLGAWLKGKQSTPWSNYLFTPVMPEIADSSDYEGDIAADMRDLEAQSQLAYDKNEGLTEEHGLNLLPEAHISATKHELKKIDIHAEKVLGDITDEVFINEMKEENTQNGK